jgi:hypothetical protein
LILLAGGVGTYGQIWGRLLGRMGAEEVMVPQEGARKLAAGEVKPCM